MIRVVLFLIAVGVVLYVVDPPEPEPDDLRLSGTVTGPCSVLTTVEYWDFVDDAGRRVGEAYLYGPLNGVERSGDECAVEFDTLGDDVPRLPRYVLKVGNLGADISLSDESSAGYVGAVTLVDRTDW